MNTKHTFSTLLGKYDKIEVPIIQRDYAQGRETPEVKRIRKKFINNFLVSSLINNEKIELDFVYGSILIERNGENKKRIFIPLDGQQRLTTLYLLHFFIAIKEGRINDIRDMLNKFNYETRPSAHDFCKKLVNEFEVEDIKNIKFEIENSEWFNEGWNNDPTVAGMINMLKTFSKNDQLVIVEHSLLDRLLNSKDPIISFYFTDLDEFGLTENLYIRMNARGKTLTEFENFKSEFFKIINYNHDLLEEVKEKIEYAWVDNLWDYRLNNSYVIDEPFMKLLSFITEMLYFKSAQRRADKYESDFLDFKLLNKIYEDEENLKFLIFSIDFVKQVKTHNKVNILWKENTTLYDIFRDVITGKLDINETYILFSALSYCYQCDYHNNLYDFLRVVRNLIHNTKDNSRREWPRLLKSVNSLISNDYVYDLLLNNNNVKDLKGFDVNQRNEEIFKAKLIFQFSNEREFIFEMEDNENFEGNIANLLLSVDVNKEKDYERLSIETIKLDTFDFKELKSTYVAYMEISKNYFNSIWGDLLVSGLYSQTGNSRLDYNPIYQKHPSIILFAKKYALKSKLNSLDEFVINIQRKFIEKTSNKYQNFDEIRDVKIQLYLYYLIHKRIYNKDFCTFFKNDNYNFGWLGKEAGYKSWFNSGIKDCQYFSNSNPIFQVYNQQFRYNLGINSNNTLDIEIVGNGKKRDPFKLIKDWAEI